MNRLNRDGHDESQYTQKVLNPKTGKMEMPPIVNAFREAKGDIKQMEEDGGLHKSITWLPDRLFYGRNITGDHLATCMSIYRAVVSTMNALKVDNVRAYLTEVIAAQNTCQCIDKDKCHCKKDIFYNLITRLNRRKSYICMWLVRDEMNNGNIGVAVREIGFIKEALEDAYKIIDDCKNSVNI